jgi:hypothetical protein
MIAQQHLKDSVNAAATGSGMRNEYGYSAFDL